MRILVTGGSGFIGTNYIELLLNSGKAEFLNLDNQLPRNGAHKSFWQECDLVDAPRLKKDKLLIFLLPMLFIWRQKPDWMRKIERLCG